MDSIDRVLMEAWNRLSAKVKTDRVEAARRLARRRQGNLSRPLRAFCVAIRANDTRIDRDPDIEVWPCRELPETCEDHFVRVWRPQVQALVKPVDLGWPGFTVAGAAARLGRSKATVWEWLKRGLFFSERYPARALGGRGRDMPKVWSRLKFDPAGVHGEGRGDLWGCMWQTHWERVPERAVLEAERVWCGAGGAGGAGKGVGAWRWVCPGLGRRLGGKKCGKRVSLLYLPVREGEMQMIKEEEEAGDDMHLRKGNWGFACRECLGVMNVTVAGMGTGEAHRATKGWNDFVARMSGGLLYGREVRRPEGWVVERARPKVVRSIARERRARVLELAGRGWGPKRMGRAMGVSRRCVQRHLRCVCEEQGVKGVRGLWRKLGVEGRRGRGRVVRGEVVR